VLRLAAHPHLGSVTGRFFDRCHLAPDVADTAPAQDFWAACNRGWKIREGLITNRRFRSGCWSSAAQAFGVRRQC
jgi:hypothetical protein